MVRSGRIGNRTALFEDEYNRPSFRKPPCGSHAERPATGSDDIVRDGHFGLPRQEVLLFGHGVELKSRRPPAAERDAAQIGKEPGRFVYGANTIALGRHHEKARVPRSDIMQNMTIVRPSKI